MHIIIMARFKVNYLLDHEYGKLHLNCFLLASITQQVNAKQNILSLILKF